jgi:hypothetical protein
MDVSDSESDCGGDTIEHSQTDLSPDLRDVTVTVEVRDDEIRAVKNMELSCVQGQREIGSMKGRLIERERLAYRFDEALDELSRDYSSLAGDIFDELGIVKKKFTKRSGYEGSGFWSDPSINWSDFLIIEQAEVVDIEHRRRGGTHGRDLSCRRNETWG